LLSELFFIASVSTDQNEVDMFNARCGVTGVILLAVCQGAASAEGLKISGLSASGFSNQNLCPAIGGAGVPPRFTVRHSRGTGSITVSMEDHLNNGNTINHGSTTIAANPSGMTVVEYGFLAPCNRRTAEGLRSAYYVTATADGSTKTILWSKYPR
jgi:hypothetical protein